MDTKRSLAAASLAMTVALCCDIPMLAGQPAETRADALGDPLPEGATARLGTTRMRHGEPVSVVAFLGDGKSLLSIAGDGVVRVWDTATGKELRRFKTTGDQPGGDNMFMQRGMGFVNGAMVVFSGMN